MKKIIATLVLSLGLMITSVQATAACDPITDTVLAVNADMICFSARADADLGYTAEIYRQDPLTSLWVLESGPFDITAGTGQIELPRWQFLRLEGIASRATKLIYNLSGDALLEFQAAMKARLVFNGSTNEVEVSPDPIDAQGGFLLE